MRAKQVTSCQEISRTLRLPISAILLTGLLSTVAHAQPSTNDDNPFKMGIEREFALETGRVLLKIEVKDAVVANLANKIIAELGNTFLIDYTWRGDVWRSEVRDSEGNTVQRSICDGKKVFAGDALWDIEFSQFSLTSDDATEVLEEKFSDLRWESGYISAHVFPLSAGKLLDWKLRTNAFTIEQVENPKNNDVVMHVKIVFLKGIPGLLVFEKEPTEKEIQEKHAEKQTNQKYKTFSSDRYTFSSLPNGHIKSTKTLISPMNRGFIQTWEWSQTGTPKVAQQFSTYSFTLGNPNDKAPTLNWTSTLLEINLGESEHTRDEQFEISNDESLPINHWRADPPRSFLQSVGDFLEDIAFSIF